jgi:hypothetical protein
MVIRSPRLSVVVGVTWKERTRGPAVAVAAGAGGAEAAGGDGSTATTVGAGDSSAVVAGRVSVGRAAVAASSGVWMNAGAAAALAVPTAAVLDATPMAGA